MRIVADGTLSSCHLRGLENQHINSTPPPLPRFHIIHLHRGQTHERGGWVGGLEGERFASPHSSSPTPPPLVRTYNHTSMITTLSLHNTRRIARTEHTHTHRTAQAHTSNTLALSLCTAAPLPHHPHPSHVTRHISTALNSLVRPHPTHSSPQANAHFETHRRRTQNSYIIAYVFRSHRTNTVGSLASSARFNLPLSHFS